MDSSTNDEEFMPDITVNSESISNKLTLELNRDYWIKALIPHANSGRLLTADIFYFCAATIQAGGENLQDIQFSTDTIRRLRSGVDEETASSI